MQAFSDVCQVGVGVCLEVFQIDIIVVIVTALGVVNFSSIPWGWVSFVKTLCKLQNTIRMLGWLFPFPQKAQEFLQVWHC